MTWFDTGGNEAPFEPPARHSAYMVLVDLLEHYGPMGLDTDGLLARFEESVRADERARGRRCAECGAEISGGAR